MNPIVGIAMVAALLGGLVALLAWWQHRCHPHPEVVRKLLHVGMGLVTLAFPVLFEQSWPVWTLAVLSTGLLLTIKHHQSLRAVGSVVDGVGRRTWGDLCFPWSVAIVFELAHGDYLLYAIPILLLALADAVAALIGVFYGHWHYTASGTSKSAEGSIAFFTVAFLSTHIPLLLATNIGRVESLLLGLTLGLLIMLIEAFSWDGWDNLLIPVGAFFFLRAYLPLEQSALIGHLSGIMAWVILILALQRFSTLDHAALLGAAVVCFITTSIGGWVWVVPALCLFFGYTALWPRSEHIANHPHTAYMVAVTSGVGLILVIMQAMWNRDDLLYPYVVNYAAHLAFMGVVWYRETHSEVGESSLIWQSTWRSWLVVCAPYPILVGLSSDSLIATIAAIIPLFLATKIYAMLLPIPGSTHREWLPWGNRMVIGLVVATIAWMPLWFWKGDG